MIPAVLEGSDGCLLALGYPGAGKLVNYVTGIIFMIQLELLSLVSNSFKTKDIFRGYFSWQTYKVNL